MTRVLVIQGAGMNMRGKTQVEIFGPLTLEEINAQVQGYADQLGLDVEFVHSNVEGEVANALYAGHDGDVAAAVINPAGYTSLNGVLRAAIAQVRFPVIEGSRLQPHGPGRRVRRAAGMPGFRVWVWRLRLLPGLGRGQEPVGLERKAFLISLIQGLFPRRYAETQRPTGVYGLGVSRWKIPRPTRSGGSAVR